MELLEKDNFIRIKGRESRWFRYVDDVLASIPENTNVDIKVGMLNAVNNDVQLTVEEEQNGQLSCLDTLIRRVGRSAIFPVYRRKTNKDDLVHYFFAHDDRTNGGIVLGLFLRAVRICSEEYLEEVSDYIMNAFDKLGYQEGLMRRLKRWQ